jgi:hypothetical protein
MEQDKKLPTVMPDQAPQGATVFPEAASDLAVIPTPDQTPQPVATVHTETKKKSGLFRGLARIFGVGASAAASTVLQPAPIAAAPAETGTTDPDHHIVMDPPTAPIASEVISLAPMKEERLLPDPKDMDITITTGPSATAKEVEELSKTGHKIDIILPGQPAPSVEAAAVESTHNTIETKGENEAAQILEPLREVLDIEHDAPTLNAISALSNLSAEEQSKKIKVENLDDNNKRLGYYINGFDNPMAQPDVLVTVKVNPEGDKEASIEFYVGPDGSIHAIPPAADQKTYTPDQLKTAVTPVLQNKTPVWSNSTSVLSGGIVAEAYKNAGSEIKISVSDSGIVLIKIKTPAPHSNV